MPRVLRVALAGREPDSDRQSELRRIFGQEVTVDTISTPKPGVIIGHARAFQSDAIVLEMSSPETVCEVQAALPDTPILSVQRKDVEVTKEIGRDERERRIQATQSESKFASYGRRNETGEIEPVGDNELNPAHQRDVADGLTSDVIEARDQERGRQAERGSAEQERGDRDREDD